MLVALGFHAATFRPEPWWGDAYQYLLHAQNLLSGQPYADTGYVPSPYAYVAPAAYPVGYPLLLAPVLALFGLDPFAIALLGTLLVLGTAWAAATLARGWLPPPYAIGLALLIAFQPALIALARLPRSDTAFVLFTTLCLLFAERASYRTTRWRRWALLAGLALAAAALTRTLGLVLIPAVLAPGLLRSRRVTAPALRAVGVGAALWLLVSLIPLGGPAVVVPDAASGYGGLIQTDLLRDLARIPARVVAYTRATFPLWEVPGVDPLKHLLFAVALVPVGVGFLHRARRRPGPAEAFVALYGLALLLWASPSARSLYPLYPLYYLYLCIGVWRLGRTHVSRQWATAALLIAAVALSYGGRYARASSAPPGERVDDRDRAVYDALREASPEDAIVLTTGDPRAQVYYTGRAVTRGPGELAEWRRYADALGATYALVRDGSEIGPALLRDPRHQLVRRDGPLTLYRICPEACVDLPAEP